MSRFQVQSISIRVVILMLMGATMCATSPVVAQVEHTPSQPDQATTTQFSDSHTTAGDKGVVDELKSLADRDLVSRENLPSTIKYIGLITVISLAPALFLMTTSYIRIVVVLSILRQALGIGQTPSTQVLTGLSLFMTVLVMTPVWSEVHQQGIKPYVAEGSELEWKDAFEQGVRPLKRFMVQQISLADNVDDIWMFHQYLPEHERQEEPETFEDVPIRVILPAFLISELKVAFMIGFSIFLPFVVLDLIVSSVSVSMGMVMLPPSMISLPMKLALFVLVDGWSLVVGMLLQSFVQYGGGL